MLPLLLTLCLSQVEIKMGPVPPVPNYGLGGQEHFAKEERATVSGKDIRPAQMLQLLQAGAPELPDDKDKPWLVYVGQNKEETAKARALLSPLASRFRIQAATEGEWYTKARDGSVRFHPGATVLLADGTEAYRTRDILGLLEKLKNLTDGFDLRKLPDLFRPAPGPILPDLPSLGAIPWWTWIGGGLVLLLLLRGGKS